MRNCQNLTVRMKQVLQVLVWWQGKSWTSGLASRQMQHACKKARVIMLLAYAAYIVYVHS